MRRLAVLVALLALGVSPTAQARPNRPVVAVVAVDGAAVRTSIGDWSARQSPVYLVLAASCTGYAHCITVAFDGFLAAWGSASGVGDAIRGTCSVTVAIYDARLLDHEFGHCLGLEHAYTDTRSIVYQGVAPYTGNYTPDRLDYRNANTAWGSTP